MANSGNAANAAKGKSQRKFAQGATVQVMAGRSMGKFGKIEDVDMESDDRPYLVTWLTSFNGAWFNEVDLSSV